MEGFDHERLDVYSVSSEFVGLADALVARLPRGWAYLVSVAEKPPAPIGCKAPSLRRTAQNVLNVTSGHASGILHRPP